MGPRRRWTCEACGAAWGASARFCGTCGAGAVTGRPSTPRRARTARRSRWVGVVVATVVVVGGLTALALRSPSTPAGLATPAAGSGSEEVVMPGRGELASPGDEAGPQVPPDQSVEPAMPVKLECGGDDCYRWWRPFDQLPVYSAWRDGEEVLFVAGDRLVVWDVETGDDRWERPIPSEVALGSQELDGRAWRPASVTADDNWVVVIGAGGVQVLTRSGEERWTLPLPDGEVPLLAAVVGDVLTVVTEAPSRRQLVDEDAPPDADADARPEPDEDGWIRDTSERGITAFELATGDVRWSREGLPLVFPPWFHDPSSQDILLIEEDGAVVALDITDGSERYRLDVASAGAVTYIGGFVVRAATTATGDAAQVVIHAAGDGRELVAFPERSVDSALAVDGLLVAIAQPSAAGSGRTGGPREEAEVIAVDAAGTLVWRVPLEGGTTAACCASVLEAGPGVVRVAAGPGVAATHLDVRSGGIVRRDPPVGPASRDEWPGGRDVVMSHTSAGLQTTVRGAPSGQPVTVLGGFAQPVTGLGGRAAQDGRLLLRVETGLIAVSLPAPGS